MRLVRPTGIADQCNPTPAPWAVLSGTENRDKLFGQPFLWSIERGVLNEQFVDKTHTIDDDWRMDITFEWASEKNRLLIRERDVSFERIVSMIEQVGPLDVLEHPNPERYPNQKIHVVEIDQYCYLVPFVIGADGTGLLKAIIPSRKATRDYRGG